MEILLDAFLAMMAAVGIWAIGGLLVDALFREPSVMLLVRAHDDGSDLKYIVRRHSFCFRDADIIFVDYGLNETGIETVSRLIEDKRHIRICSKEHVEDLVKEAEKWTKQDSAVK